MPEFRPLNNAEFRRQLAGELTGNILPFWIEHVVDEVNGGFYGALSNDLQVHNEEPRSAVLCARILWTYAAAYRRFGTPAYLEMAGRAYDYLTGVFWDAQHDGVYWSVDAQGRPLLDRKHHYAQAFALYGLSEYYRATHEARSLALAQRLFELLETYAYEPAYGGYIEGRGRGWDALADMRLSDKDLNCRKSMNTMLHILEAYTNLLRVWDDDRLRRQHRALIETFQQHIIAPGGHFRLFFDDDWTSLSANVSYGHDIEGSWLLAEAAEAQGDAALLASVRRSALELAGAVYRSGRDEDGSLFYEGGPHGLIHDYKDWWVQAEAMVGFYHAYQCSRQAQFLQAAGQCWDYIQTHLVDRLHGDWYKHLDRQGRPDASQYKVSAWDCPYHHSRACLELLARLPE